MVVMGGNHGLRADVMGGQAGACKIFSRAILSRLRNFMNYKHPGVFLAT
jgi:hypothetical protein